MEFVIIVFVKDIQLQIFDKIKERLLPGQSLVDVITSLLHISKDAGYRRIRGEVPLTIHEAIKISNNYDFSLDNIEVKQQNKVSFQYEPLNTKEFEYNRFIQKLSSGFDFVERVQDPYLYTTIGDSSILHLSNFPRLSSFKYFYWAKSYLNVNQYKSLKFSEEIIDKAISKKYSDIIRLYNKIPSSEVFSFDAFNGFLKQIFYYFELEVFEAPELAIQLIDDVLALKNHLKEQAECGFKITIQKDQKIQTSTPFKLYVIDTYLPDNTFVLKHKTGLVTYFTHNVMNYLVINDMDYNMETIGIIEQQIRNSTLISEASEKIRNKFFRQIESNIQSYRAKILSAM